MIEISSLDQKILQALQQGLPLASRPYEEIGRQVGASEAEVIARLEQLLEQGVIRRLGIVTKHRQLGYTSNAMVVWDIPDDLEPEMGKRFSEFDFVTLCYRRKRYRPKWPYNLFCMIHGQDRETVLQQVAHLRKTCGLEQVAYDVLFSGQCFKQRGAHYFKTA